MRLLIISDFYPPVIGGMERYVQTLAHEMARRGHHVAVATLRTGDAPGFENDEGVRVHRLVGWSRALAPFYESSDRPFHPTAPDPGIMAGLRRVVEHERPDIVHAQGWMLYSFLPLKEWSKTRLVVTLHDYGLVCPKKTYLHFGHVCDGPALTKCVRCASEQYGAVKSAALTVGLRLSSPLHARVDRYLAVSEAVRSASEPGRAGQPIDVAPAFIPDDTPCEAVAVERPPFLPPEDNYILFVGVLSNHKGLRVLLEAYEGLHARVPLVLIGTPHADTPTEFPAGVTVARNVPHPAVVYAWMHCAVGTVPSIWPDPCPLVAIEAMACGRPLVVSAIGGLTDLVVDGETGLQVPPGDVPALREALAALLANDARRDLLGAQARLRSSLFTASAVSSRLEQVYASLLD